jgi:hypothetical protein
MGLGMGCLLERIALSFGYILLSMRIRSSYFKKEYDLQKAELVGRGTFAEVLIR